LWKQEFTNPCSVDGKVSNIEIEMSNVGLLEELLELYLGIYSIVG
jgi:hypothetical protein